MQGGNQCTVQYQYWVAKYFCRARDWNHSVQHKHSVECKYLHGNHSVEHTYLCEASYHNSHNSPAIS
ncbi:hypothetical protein OS493_022675 [Desmophyllum pertusum]|uniref:Uncharacterized protein n=1 Tax=Desmophyllum pertusum TaxID=174260 RepID=A0A9X0CL78_9CNID|nr:hypothetical protein OS493_022675 [Desmophyllum pertusum]